MYEGLSSNLQLQFIILMLEYTIKELCEQLRSTSSLFIMFISGKQCNVRLSSYLYWCQNDDFELSDYIVRPSFFVINKHD